MYSDEQEKLRQDQIKARANQLMKEGLTWNEALSIAEDEYIEH